jgi:hypothetical protein
MRSRRLDAVRIGFSESSAHQARTRKVRSGEIGVTQNQPRPNLGELKYLRRHSFQWLTPSFKMSSCSAFIMTSENSKDNGNGDNW